MEILDKIPRDLINFLLVAIFSLLIGLEQRRKFQKSENEKKVLFGTDRTYAFTGILGFVLYVVSPVKLYLYMLGGVSLVVFLAVFYIKKIQFQQKYGITAIITLLITYGLTPLIYTKPLWLTLLVVTVVLLLTEMKEQFRALTKKFDDEEFITIASFLVISGVILPLLPDKIIIELIPISPFKFWLAVVVVSGISYFSYILQKFVFPNKGLLITGFIGGLYSSTATTVVLARKSKTNKTAAGQISASIILATTMMFIRIYIIALIFNAQLAKVLLPSFAILTVLCVVLAFVIFKFSKNKQKSLSKVKDKSAKNPLEFKTALLFAALFVIFGLLTEFVLEKFGQSGLNILSLVVGVTDIDPFLVSLFTGKYNIDINSIATATLIAITSNNILKLAYSIWFGIKQIRKPLIIAYSIIVLVGTAIVLYQIL